MPYNFSGDESLSQPIYHGNARSTLCQPRNRIAPSLARSIETSPLRPAALYNTKMMSAATIDDQRLKVPSNKRQIKDLQSNHRRLSGLNDFESVLLRLSKEYKSFQLYVVAPRVILVIADPMVIKYSRKILKSVSWREGTYSCSTY